MKKSYTEAQFDTALVEGWRAIEGIRRAGGTVTLPPAKMATKPLPPPGPAERAENVLEDFLAQPVSGVPLSDQLGQLRESDGEDEELAHLLLELGIAVRAEGVLVSRQSSLLRGDNDSRLTCPHRLIRTLPGIRRCEKVTFHGQRSRSRATILDHFTYTTRA